MLLEGMRKHKGSRKLLVFRKVMQAYMNRYGCQPTDEDVARIHNGGPNGYRKPETVAYWKENLTAKKNEL